MIHTLERPYSPDTSAHNSVFYQVSSNVTKVQLPVTCFQVLLQEELTDEVTLH